MSWQTRYVFKVGGLSDMGLDTTERYLLTASTSGRGVFDLHTGQRVARDCEVDKAYAENGELEGIGILAGKNVPVWGLFGHTPPGWLQDEAARMDQGVTEIKSVLSARRGDWLILGHSDAVYVFERGQSHSAPTPATDNQDPAPTSLVQLRTLTQMALFAALIGAGAFIHIPFGPFFLSLQTMMVMLTGFMLGPKKAILAMILYLACGFVGLPVFGRGKAGPTSFLGPTAGYFAGFVLGAAIAGLGKYVTGGKFRRLAGMVLFGALGTIALLGLGAVWMRYSLFDSWHTALTAGFYPFLPGDMVKMLAAAVIKETFFPEPNRQTTTRHHR